jgi:hypothetical protein
VYVSDPSNAKIYMVDRVTLQTLTPIGDGGCEPGQFYSVHSLFRIRGAVSKRPKRGAQRVANFVCKGLGGATKWDQGVFWPKTPPM